jgi:hypothetical protein
MFQIKLEFFLATLLLYLECFGRWVKFFWSEFGNYFSQIVKLRACEYALCCKHNAKCTSLFFAKHIILSSSKHKHLWGNWTLGIGHSSKSDLQTHKLVFNYNKQNNNLMALHYKNRPKNANTMERKFLSHKTTIQFCSNTNLFLQKLTQQM